MTKDIQDVQPIRSLEKLHEMEFKAALFRTGLHYVFAGNQYRFTG